MSKNKPGLVGLDYAITSNLIEDIKNARNLGYGFVVVPLFHPHLKRDYLQGKDKLNKAYPLTRTDMVFQETDITNVQNLIVGKMSAWIDCDSADEYYRKNSEKALESELSWAAYLGIPVVQIALRRSENPNLARVVNSFLDREGKPFRVWISLQASLSESIENVSGPSCDGDRQESLPIHPWNWWTKFMSLCSENSSLLQISLTIPSDLSTDPRELDRWYSEPIAALQLSTSTFSTNSKGFPALTRAHQELVKRFYTLNLQIVISGCKRHGRELDTYKQYMAHLYDTMKPDDIYTIHAKGMEDFLQEPLQPLADNLSSATYAIFEIDPYKYRAYEQAVYRALLDRHKQKQKNLQSPSQVLESTVIMVLGAGRGPLVAACFKASKRAELPIRVYIVEKNPNAIVTLRNRIDDEWKEEDVIFLPGDMRLHEPPEKADIFVSELLGSFGDNELSPECLNGAQKYLKDDGISIPCSYTSYLAPMQSWKIYKEITSDTNRNKPERAPFETPYVVRLKNCHVLTNPQPAFTFVHPKTDDLDDGSRFTTLSFTMQMNSVVHGLAGYFHSILYDDITMSIHPQFHSPDMFSWFPLVFPLRNPISLKEGDVFTVSMWRVVGPRSVWYEWCVTDPITTPIHNPGGRSYSIGI